MKTEIIDTFWENWNLSRCKTAMLVISVIIVLSMAICEITGNGSDALETAFYVIIGYWTGRTSKVKDIK